MTARGMSAAARAQAAASSNQPIHLIAVYFDDLTARYTDAYRNIVWGGDTFTAAGSLLEFSGITESIELRVTQAQIRLSGVDQVWIAWLLAKQYVDRRVVIWKGFLSSTDSLVVDPVAILDGRMDAQTIEENPNEGTCIVTVSASSHWVDFERRPGRHTNDAEQQRHFSGDKGFEFAAQASKQITWGRATPGSAQLPSNVVAPPDYDQFYGVQQMG